MLVVNPPPRSWIELVRSAMVSEWPSFVVLRCRKGSAFYDYVTMKVLEGTGAAVIVADLFASAVTWADQNGGSVDACIETYQWSGGVPLACQRKCIRITTEVQE